MPVEHVVICDTEMTDKQTAVIMAAFSSASSKTKTLNIGRSRGVRSVEPVLLARAAANLEELDLSNLGLSSHQLKAILTEVSAGGSRLKKLDIRFNWCLDSVAPGVLARGLNSLEDIFISPTNLTREQAEALFTAIIGGTKLKIINMALCNLAPVEPALLANALNMLEVVNMTMSGLDNHPLKAIATSLASGLS